MSLSPDIDAITPSLKRKHAICFFWSNPVLVKSLVEFINYLDRKFLITFFVVTNDYPGKLLFLKEGVQAFSIGELLDKAPKGNCLKVADADIDDLLQYDLAVGHFKIDDYGGREGLFSYAREVLNAYSLLAQEFNSQMAFVWNGAAFWQRAMAYVAKEHHLPCFFMERGLFPGTLVVDPEGVNYGSSIAGHRWERCRATEPSAEDVVRLDEFRQNLVLSRQTIVAHGQDLTSEEAQERLEIPPGATVVLLPLQIESDSNILFYSPLYKSMPAVIRDVVEVLEAYPDVYLVVKPHPEDRDRLVELDVFRGPRCQLNADLSLPTLLGCADVVVTINSTVGIEALLCGKPVVTLGQAVYGKKGFTFDIDDRSDLAIQFSRALSSVREGQLEMTGFNDFLVYLLKFHLFCIAGKDVWGSRRTIGLSIISKIGFKEGDEYPPVAPWFDVLVDGNKNLVLVLKGNANNVKRRILLLFNSAYLGDLLLDLKNNVGVDEIHNISLLGRIRLIFERKYFLVLVERKDYGRWGNLLFRAWWHILRAEQKIELM